MADKKFGVKQIDLIGASGTPTLTSPNNLNIEALEVNINNDLGVSGIITSNQLNVSGVVTASSFSGSASGLTGIPAGQLTGALPALDGSALTGIVASGTGIVIREEGTPIGTAGTINFVGAGVTATFSSGIATVSITASDGNIAGIDTSGTSTFNNLNVTGVSTVGVVTGATYFGDGSRVVDGRWTVAAPTSSAYTFSGVGFLATTSNPVLYLTRGRVYEFVITSGGSHPFQIRTSSGGSAYNDGVTNNGATSGTLVFEVPFNAPSTLYYQCTSHGGMGNTINILDGTNLSQLNVSGVSTFAGITTVTGTTLFAKQLNVSGVSTLTSNVSVGGTISVDGAVKLITNNATIVGTSGSTGEIKRIGGAPFFYDGSAWREFVLSTGTPVAVPADLEWNNVILRSTYDTDAPGFFDFKFSQHPSTVGSGATTVASPVKIGTKSFRNNGSIGAGISYAYRAEHDFTGAWTIEFWINHDGLPYGNTNYPEAMVSQISLVDTNNNWSFGVRYGGSGNYHWIWNNEVKASTQILHSVSESTFTDNFVSQWNHYALVRQANNGSLHFYINGYEVGITTNNSIIDNDITSTSGAGLHIGGAFSDTINGIIYGTYTSIDAFFDDLRITLDDRYVSVGNTTTQVYVPSTTALPTTGTLSSFVQPPGDKYGEITLGGSPTWRGTSGVTVSQQSSGNYRVSFASTYTNSNDYFVLSHAMDQGFASYVGVARSTTHVDFAVNKESDNSAVDTGSLSVQIKNHI